MDQKYNNESSILFDKCSKNEKVRLIIYMLNIFIMIFALFVTNLVLRNILNYGLMILNIIYVVLNGYNDIFLMNKAEDELRRTFIGDSFDANLTTTKATNYYSNNSEPSIKRMGMNCFESTLYTSRITEKMIFSKLLKFLLLVIAWIIIITQTSNMDIVVLLTQIIFSVDVIADLVKTIYYHCRAKRLFENFYTLFVTKGCQSSDLPLIVEYTMEYECLKSYCHIILPNKVFDSVKDELTQKWVRILSDFDRKNEKQIVLK